MSIETLKQTIEKFLREEIPDELQSSNRRETLGENKYTYVHKKEILNEWNPLREFEYNLYEDYDDVDDEWEY